MRQNATRVDGESLSKSLPKYENGNPVAISVSVLRIGQSFRRATQINIKFDILCRIGSALSCHVLRWFNGCHHSEGEGRPAEVGEELPLPLLITAAACRHCCQFGRVFDSGPAGKPQEGAREGRREGEKQTAADWRRFGGLEGIQIVVASSSLWPLWFRN